MRPRAVRFRLAAMALGAVAAGLIIGAAPAHATPLSFVQALNSAGIVVYDASSAISSGYRICDALTVANGEVVAQQVFTHTSWADVPNIDTARVWVIVSAQELCPNMIHGQAAPAAPTPGIGQLERA